jgi:hypothetical protein
VDVLGIVDVDPQLFADETVLALEETTPRRLFDLHPLRTFVRRDTEREELDDHAGTLSTDP